MGYKIDKNMEGLLGYHKNITYGIKKDLLENHKVVVGTMFREMELLDEIEVNQSHPLLVAKQVGFRIVVIDCEHKAFNQERLSNYAKIAHNIGISLWLRPTQQEEEAISQYADIGFSGFMIPNAIKLPRIRKIIDQAYFSPVAEKHALIKRGYSISDILLDGKVLGSISMREEMNYINDNMIVFVQMEHPRGIDNLGKLLSVSEGITGTIIGPNDLAINLSILEKVPHLIELERDKIYEDEAMLMAYESIGKTVSDKKKVAGVHFTEKSQVKLINRLVSEGRFHNYSLILFGTERNLLEKEFGYTKEIIETIG